MPDYITVCENAARAGGAVLLEKLGRVQFREKGPADLVTEADIEAQKTVSNVILASFPDHEIIGEETIPDLAAQNKSDFQWIIDPLDGTTNFVHEVPHFCVSVALKCGNDLLVGAVFNPISNECYTAAAGCGAYLNGIPIRTSKVSQPSEALCGVGFPPGVKGQSPDLRAFLNALPKCQALRRTGSAALNLCYVAAGRFDATWSFSTRIWDMAAGALIVHEAGGIVTLPRQSFQPHHVGRWDFLDSGHYLACSTEKLHKSILELICNAAEQ